MTRLTVRSSRLCVEDFDHPAFAVLLISDGVPQVIRIVVCRIAFANVYRVITSDARRSFSRSTERKSQSASGHSVTVSTRGRQMLRLKLVSALDAAERMIEIESPT